MGNERNAKGYVATEAERDELRRIAEAGDIESIGMPRATLARIGAGFGVREGTIALFRARMSARRTRDAHGPAMPPAMGVGVAR